MRLRTQFFLGYAGVFGLMAVVVVFAYNGFTSHAKTTAWVAHTHEAIAEAHLIEKLLSDMESTQRGFLITGEDEFLEPFYQGHEEYEVTMVDLKLHVEDNPDQVNLLEKIERLVEEWDEVAAQPEINERRKITSDTVDAEYLQEILLAGVGKRILDEMHGIMNDMVNRFCVDGNAKGEALTEALAKAIADGEAGQREYLITGQDEFLVPFRQGIVEIETAATGLRTLVNNSHDRGSTVNDLNRLEELAIQWRLIAGEPEIALRREVDAGNKTQQDIEDTLSRGVGKATLDEMHGIMDKMEQMFTFAENDMAENLLIRLAKAMVDQETGQRGFIITGKDEFLDPYISGRTDFDNAITALRNLNANAYDVPTMLRDIRSLEMLVTNWLSEAAEPEIRFREQMNQTTTSIKAIHALISSGTGKSVMEPLRRSLGEFLRVENTLLADRIDSVKKAQNRSTITAIFGTIITIAIGISGMLFTTRSIQRQVGGEPSEIAMLTEQIARGELDAVLSKNTQHTGILASVSTMAASLQKTETLVIEQDWFKNGQTGLADTIRGDIDLPTLCTKAISYLAEYLDVQIGVIYVANYDDNNYQLMGSYAYDRRKNLNERIEPGKGLVGQVALEKKAICVSDVPQDYIMFSSGLGEAVPCHLLATPAILNGQVKAVLELGAFHPIDDTKTEFLKRVSESIAVAVTSAQDRKKMKILLEESQCQQEELQLQQEELRWSNKELEEQTQALKSSEENLKNQAGELRATNEELEKKSGSLERQKAEIELRNKSLDITKREIEEKANELEIASKYKSEFLANMSHELRTPLNSLLILSESLAGNEEGNLTDKQVEAANVIHGGGKELLTLINDILDLSKVEAGKLDIHFAEVAVDTITGDLQRQFAPVAQQKKLDFKIATAEGVPAVLCTDQQRVGQIIRNLLSNAFKFTHQGSITLRVGRPDQGVRFHTSDLNASNAIGFSVIDTGIGIPHNKQQAIFEAFQQADGSTSRKFGGTGLGLAISREMSKLLGGEIQVTSQEGQGSTFTLYLSLEGASGQSSERHQEPAGWTSPAPKQIETVASSAVEQPADIIEPEFLPDDRRQLDGATKVVLVIEDDTYFAKALMDSSRGRGYKCLAAGDGRSGVLLAAKYLPTAIILDMGLPDMDGLSVLDQLKHNLDTRHIPVHIVSASDSTSEELEKGAIGHLTKPANTDDIDAVFGKLESVLQADLKSVLVVEDDDLQRDTLVKLIANKGVNITAVSTGKEAYERISSQQFGCIILDLGLPDMTGLKLLRDLSNLEGVELPPVVVYTAREVTHEENMELRRYTKSIVIKGVGSLDRVLDETALFLHSVTSTLSAEQKNTIRMLHDPDQVLQGRKVLLVDDDPRNLFALSSILEKVGLEVVMAENGRAALDLLEASADFEMVVMDIMMPVMDGHETMREIRAQQRFHKLPIIALTAKAMPEDRSKCLESGANDYMTKPVNVEKLLSLMRVLLFKRETATA